MSRATHVACKLLRSVCTFAVFAIAQAILCGNPATAAPAEIITKSTNETTAPMKAKWMETSNASWVWPASSGDGPNQYVQLMQDITVADDTPVNVQLAISADTNYAAWLNGQFAGFGQLRNYPDDKTYDVLDLSALAKPGTNHLCVEVYYQGEDSSTYRKGAPGAVFAVQAGDKVIAASGSDTRMRQAPDYISGRMPKVTGQLGFTFEHRGDRKDGWLEPGYAPDQAWVTASDADMKPMASRPVRPRPIRKLVTEKRLPMRIVSQGAFTRTVKDAGPADGIQTDALSFRQDDELFENPRPRLADGQTTGLIFKPQAWKDATGAYIVLDTGHEEAGLLDLDLEAPAGTIVDIGYGEHLEDLRVRARVGGRHFANRHICGQGRERFLHPFLRLAGRYLELHITPPAGSVDPSVVLHYAGLRPTPFPVEHTGSFASPDSLHNRIYDVSRRTLELCMHDHYEDCPWREQALYAMDARNQALAGYYCFGNYDFAANSIKLLGQGYNESDGFLELCAPARVSITIPSFSLAWILMLHDHLMYSGDREFTKSQLATAHRILETCNRLSSGSLIGTPQGPRMWNFYEWAPGLDGSGPHASKAVNENLMEAPLNLFYLLALDAATSISRQCGEDAAPFETRAAALRSAFANTFWDDKEKAFRTRTGDGQPPHYAELTQALAILADVVPRGELNDLRQRLAADNNGLVPCTISHTLYKFEALLSADDKYAPRVFELIKRDWGYMLSQGATSFWETIDGASAFGNAGSLCHGWSGVPAWFYGAYVLGVKPTEPGFTKYESNPVHGVFDKAEGTVPTPSGIIPVKWEVIDGKIRDIP